MDAKEIASALRVCNNPKGLRCSTCPVFSRYEYRACKATVDRLAADLIESLTAENARLTTERDEAQRRADAAVEDLIKIAEYSGSLTCH